jgi:outer membrane protein
VASIGADHVWREGDDYVFSIGPRVLFSDSNYQRAWFGVDSDSAVTSGLPQYRPDTGIHAVAATSGATYRLSARWGLFGFGLYERLLGDAAKSPIVRELGSRDQFSVGAGLTYSFTIRR